MFAASKRQGNLLSISAQPLDKANKDLELQRRMTKHYPQRNQFARVKLKKAQGKLSAPKEEKYQARIVILAQSSLQVS